MYASRRTTRSNPLRWGLAGLVLAVTGAAWLPAARAPCTGRVIVDLSVAEPDDAWVAIAVQELARDLRAPGQIRAAADEPGECATYRKAQLLTAAPPWRLVHERPDGSHETLHGENLAELVAAVVDRGRPLATAAIHDTAGEQPESSAGLAADLRRAGVQALQQDHLAVASQRLRRAARLSWQDQDWPATATALLALALARASGPGGQRDAQQVQWDTARRIASRLGLREVALDAQLLQAEMLLAAGHADGAAALARAGLLSAQLRLSPRLERDAYAVLGQALLASGQPVDAEAALRAALATQDQEPIQRLRLTCALRQAVARQSKWRDMQPFETPSASADEDTHTDETQAALENRYCAAQLAHMSGEHDAAESGWLQVPRQASAQGRESLLRRSATALGALALQRGDMSTAEPWLGLALTGGAEDAAVRRLLEQYRALPLPVRRNLPWAAPGDGRSAPVAAQPR